MVYSLISLDSNDIKLTTHWSSIGLSYRFEWEDKKEGFKLVGELVAQIFQEARQSTKLIDTAFPH
jgi:hypothetical protein